MKVVEVKIPSVGESITEVTIAQWLKKNGDWVKEDQPLCEIESEKATVELPSPLSGTLEILVNAGESIKIGAVVAKITESNEIKSDNKNKSEVTPSPKEETKNSHAVIASPAADKILREKNIDPSTVQGSGKDGRVTKEDAINHPTSKESSNNKEIEPHKSLVPTMPEIKSHQREIKKQKMTMLRKTIAKRLLFAKNQTAMLTTFNEINMFEVMNLRKKYKDAFKEKYDISLGFMSFFTKAVCLSLEKFPIVNAQIDGDEMIFHNYCDIGVAVSTPKGLVVPVVRDAESLSLAAIEKSISNMALKARDGKLTMEEMTGGTFTITNGGVFGSMLSTPILNTPQSAILGMHNIVERPWVVNGEIVIRPIMYVALSYDHRIIDGKDSVGFLKSVKELIEDPSRLLLDI
jgi:2-oxoglutarate dehydrogenase E2 component (dihydrolipoamide succinyltransferase)